MAKSSKIELERRIFTIQGWIIDGVQDYLILKQSKSQWSIGLRQSRNYLKKAYQNWKEDIDIDIDLKRSAKIAELKQLKRSLKEEHKGSPSGIRAIMMVEREIIKIEGLVIRKVDITSGGKPLQISDEERDARIEVLINKRNANKG
jgi:hypothetical protein